MAASARICCGGGGGGSACSLKRDRRTVNVRPTCLVPISGRHSRRCSEIGKISMSMAETAPLPAVKLEGMRIGEGKYGGRGGAVVSREKLDEWMRDSVADIVKNLRESPLLVHVYEGTNGDLTTTTTTTTAAEKAEEWPAVKIRWERGQERMPEGVILVEELEDVDRDSTEENGGDGGRGGYGEGTRAWGIVAQGRGIDCGPVCYLLKTSRVGSGFGAGAVCTHFCLTKVKSFRETAMSQLNNCWLVQAGQ